MRFRDDKPADLDRARAAVAEWREQHPAGTEDQLTAALGPKFHPDYGPVLRAVLFTLDRHHAQNNTGAARLTGVRRREAASPTTDCGFPYTASRPSMAGGGGGRAPPPPPPPRPCQQPPHLQPWKAAPDMTTGLGQPPQPAPRDDDHDEAGQYLTALGAMLTVEGIACRLTRDGGTPTLHAEQPGGAPNPVTVVIDPGNGPGFWIDCTCIWTPPADATPGETADTVLAVLNAIRPAPGRM
jgi:hypothetical protein